MAYRFAARPTTACREDRAASLAQRRRQAGHRFSGRLSREGQRRGGCRAHQPGQAVPESPGDDTSAAARCAGFGRVTTHRIAKQKYAPAPPARAAPRPEQRSLQRSPVTCDHADNPGGRPAVSRCVALVSLAVFAKSACAYACPDQEQGMTISATFMAAMKSITYSSSGKQNRREAPRRGCRTLQSH